MIHKRLTNVGRFLLNKNRKINMGHLIAGSVFSGLLCYLGYWSVVVNEEVRESRRANRKMERSE